MAEPVRVGELLAALPGMRGRLAEARLLRAWPDIAGPAGARSRAEGVDAGILHVAVDTPGWLHRLRLEEGDLLGRCRSIADVHAIRFHLAPATAGAPPPGESLSASGPRGHGEGDILS